MVLQVKRPTNHCSRWFNPAWNNSSTKDVWNSSIKIPILHTYILYMATDSALIGKFQEKVAILAVTISGWRLFQAYMLVYNYNDNNFELWWIHTYRGG